MESAPSPSSPAWKSIARDPLPTTMRAGIAYELAGSEPGPTTIGVDRFIVTADAIKRDYLRAPGRLIAS